ncbi:MAG: AraC family transcriptional regulator [Sphingomonadales bacterium]
MLSFITSDDIFRARAEGGHYRTANLLEGCDYVRRTSEGHELRSIQRVSRFELQHRRMEIRRVKIDFVRIDCGHDFEVEQVHELGFYACKIPLGGQCEFRVGGVKHVARPGDVFAGNPFEPIRKRFTGPYTQAIVRVDRDCLEELVAAELGRPLDQPIRFDTLPRSDASTALLTNLIGFLWLDMDGGAASQHWRIARHFERALLMAMLRGVPSNYSAELERRGNEVAPFYIRKAEAFIRAHLEEPITTGDIVAASGVSGRSLYYGFRRWRQTTPMAYLKGVRLDRAREELLAASVRGGSITDIALGVGYSYMSRFSADYKARFGERPSETLLGCREERA